MIACASTENFPIKLLWLMQKITFVFLFRDEHPEPSSIHGSGMEFPFAQDGAAGYKSFDPQVRVLNGKTIVYKFIRRQFGTALYHKGSNMMKNDSLGLGKLFVIHPKNSPYNVSKDFALQLQTWNFFQGNENRIIATLKAFFITLNIKTAPEIEMMIVKQGDRVRIHIENLSFKNHPTHLNGYIFKFLGTRGGLLPRSLQSPVVTVNVPTLSPPEIEFIAWIPRTWCFNFHILHRIINAMADTPMNIAPAEDMFTYLQVLPGNPN